MFGVLAAARVTSVVVSFDGYGDSGQIESVETKAGDDPVPLPSGDVELSAAVWGTLEAERRRMTIAEAIEKLAYDFLEETHSGWETDDDAYGDFTFDVEQRTISLQYNERHVAFEHHSHEF